MRPKKSNITHVASGAMSTDIAVPSSVLKTMTRGVPRTLGHVPIQLRGEAGRCRLGREDGSADEQDACHGDGRPFPDHRSPLRSQIAVIRSLEAVVKAITFARPRPDGCERQGARRLELTSFKPLKARGTAQAGVYDQLRQALLNAEFRPGQLLSVRTLADAFGVSAMPVREAASRLITEGCLEALNQRGLRVPVIDEAKAKEILALRLVLEGLAVERVARSATAAQIRKLEQIEQRLETAAREGESSSGIEDKYRIPSFNLPLRRRCDVVPVNSYFIPSLCAQFRGHGRAFAVRRHTLRNGAFASRQNVAGLSRPRPSRREASTDR